jgi:hypothetical protein
VKASRALRIAPVVVLIATACEDTSPSPPAPRSYSAPGGEVARVASIPIPASLVAAVTSARGVDPRAAMEDLVSDALGAEGARAQGLDRRADVGWAVTAALGRRVPLRLFDEARALGPPTDDELDEVTVVHAVVLRTRSLEKKKALVVAAAMADAARGATDTASFKARVSRAATGVRTSIEELAPFDATGLVEGGRRIDPDFVAAAFQLHVPGDTSPVVETSFGWHVIGLVGRAPSPARELGSRRSEMEEAVVALRGRARLAALLRARRAKTPVELAAGTDELLSKVSAQP